MATIQRASRRTVALENFNTRFGLVDLKPYARGMADIIQPLISSLTADDIEYVNAHIDEAIRAKR